VFAGALFMTWPALLNGYPLIFPDSMTYIEDGGLVARAVFLHKLSDYYGFRSFIYSLGIYPISWNISVWPVVALNALLVAYLSWLVVRSILPRNTIGYFLILCATLSLLTSASWYSSLILPDILGPVLYLCIYLLVFASESLSRVERWAIIVIAWWTVSSHASHLMVAIAACIALALVRMIWRKSTHIRWNAVGEVALIIFFSAGALVALNTYLYGKPSLMGEWPPVLTARVIDDGPGRWYLQQHCADAKFALCEDANKLPDSTDGFLWDTDGIWQTASDEKSLRLRHEELPFVLAVLRTYPRAQISKSAHNFWDQLTFIGLEDLGSNEWVSKEFDTVLPSGRTRYLQSRQAHDDLPFDLFMAIQKWTLVASLGAIVLFTILLWRRRSPRLVGLALVIFFTVIVNAFVTGVLSGVEERYQTRVIWLLPLLTVILILNWRDHRKPA
jgi:hypothetical protein